MLVVLLLPRRIFYTEKDPCPAACDFSHLQQEGELIRRENRVVRGDDKLEDPHIPDAGKIKGLVTVCATNARAHSVSDYVQRSQACCYLMIVFVTKIV